MYSKYKQNRNSTPLLKSKPPRFERCIPENGCCALRMLDKVVVRRRARAMWTGYWQVVVPGMGYESPEEVLENPQWWVDLTILKLGVAKKSVDKKGAIVVEYDTDLPDEGDLGGYWTKKKMKTIKVVGVVNEFLDSGVVEMVGLHEWSWVWSVRWTLYPGYRTGDLEDAPSLKWCRTSTHKMKDELVKRGNLEASNSHD